MVIFPSIDEILQNMHKLTDFTHKTVPGVTDGGSQYMGQFAV